METKTEYVIRQEKFMERREKATKRAIEELKCLQLNCKEKEFITEVVDRMMFYGKNYSRDVRYMTYLIDAFRRGICSCADDVLVCDTIGLRKIH